MHPLNKDDLHGLIETRGWPRVSLFMPAMKRGEETRQNVPRFKNLLSAAERKLTERGLRGPDASALLKPGTDLIDDEDFWNHQDAGLACFFSGEGHRVRSLPFGPPERVFAGDRFEIKPLLPLLAEEGRFFLLALDLKRARLFEGNSEGLVKRPLEGGPTSLDEARRFDVPEKQLRFHTASPGGRRGREAVFHGQGGAADVEKDAVRQFFHGLDRAVQKSLAGTEAPLVLVGTEPLVPIYRRANRYPRLEENAIVRDPESMDDAELHRRALEIVRPRFLEARHRARLRYGDLAGTGKASHHLPSVIRAAWEGRVDTLFLAEGAAEYGLFDPDEGGIEEIVDPAPGEEDLLDLAAHHALAKGGTVHVLPPEEMPEGAPAAALFRY